MKQCHIIIEEEEGRLYFKIQGNWHIYLFFLWRNFLTFPIFINYTTWSMMEACVNIFLLMFLGLRYHLLLSLCLQIWLRSSQSRIG